MSEFRIDQIKSQDASRGPDIAGITTFTGTSGIVMPSGITEYRGGRGGRGLIMGGFDYPTHINVIQKIELSTLGNAQDFGDLTIDKYAGASFSSSTRGLYVSGRREASPLADIRTDVDAVILSSGGGSFDFGELSSAVKGDSMIGLSNNVRGVFGGGILSPSPAPANKSGLNYITIATNGSSTSFGDLLEAVRSSGTASSPTRGLFGGGNGNGPLLINTIQFITISSTGNTSDFGDMTLALRAASGASSNVRAVFAGGYNASPIAYNQGSDQINYVTITSAGNAIDFGNLAANCKAFNTSVSNSTRGAFGGGPNDPAQTNNLSYVTIATLGNATDFGDLINPVISSSMNVGDSHGGIG